MTHTHRSIRALVIGQMQCAAVSIAVHSIPQRIVPTSLPMLSDRRQALCNARLSSGSEAFVKRFRAQAPRPRQPAVAALGFFRKKIATSGAVDDILTVVEDTERGCSTSRPQRASIDAALGVLEGAGDSPINKGLSATWKLLWTTEKVNCMRSLSANCQLAPLKL